jgi:hypothetical protein
MQVRAAMPGMPVSEQNCHPFQWGRYMWMHNGMVSSPSCQERSVENIITPEQNVKCFFCAGRWLHEDTESLAVRSIRRSLRHGAVVSFRQRRLLFCVLASPPRPHFPAPSSRPPASHRGVLTIILAHHTALVVCDAVHPYTPRKSKRPAARAQVAACICAWREPQCYLLFCRRLLPP